MQLTIAHVLDRVIRLRRQLEIERRAGHANPSRLLRLQALLLLAQKRVADLVAPTVPGLVPVLATTHGSRPRSEMRR